MKETNNRKQTKQNKGLPGQASEAADIYELLNDLNIEEDEFTELPADELESRRVKNAVLQRIEAEKNQGHRTRGRWAKTAAACALAALVGVSGFGLALPTYAREVPVVGDIFRYLDNGRTGKYELYKESAVAIDISRENENARITLNDGIFDGNTLYLTYTITTREDLGEHPQLDAELRFDRSLGIKGWGGTRSLERVEKGVYVGMETISMNGTNGKGLDAFQSLPFTWIVNEVRGSEAGMPESAAEGSAEGSEEGAEAQGRSIACGFHYSVTLSALAEESRPLSLKAEEPENGVTISLNELIVTEVNAALKYTVKISDQPMWHSVRVDWSVTDDLGTVYDTQDMGGSGREEDGRWTENTFLSLSHIDPKAKTLILTPQIYYAGTDENGERIWNGARAFETTPNRFEIPIR